MLMIEDISTEKRIKSTMARYMDPSLAERVMQAGEELGRRALRMIPAMVASLATT